MMVERDGTETRGPGGNNAADVPSPSRQAANDSLILRAVIGNEVSVELGPLRGRRKSLVAGEAVPFISVPSDRCWIVISGVIEKAMTDRNGARRILGFHFRGEVCGLVPRGQDRIGYGLVAATDAVVFPVTKADLVRSSGGSHQGSAITETVIVEVAMAHRWTANLARSSHQRVACFLQETFARLHASGMTREMFGTETTIAQAVGLSLVQVNRSLKQLEADGCLGRRGRRLCIGDESRLADASGGETRQLHKVLWSVDAPPVVGDRGRVQVGGEEAFDFRLIG